MRKLYSFQQLELMRLAIKKNMNSRLLLLFIGLMSFHAVNAQIISKELVNVSPAASGARGHLDLTYEVSVTNNTGLPMTEFALTDKISAANNFGAAFSNISGPVQLISSPAGNFTPNGNYNGGTDDTLIFFSPGLLNTQTLVVSFKAEVYPLAPGAPSVLQNTAIINGGNSAVHILPDCWKDCVVACNTLVNIAANSQCEVDILSEMILEGEDEECTRLGFFTVQLTDINGLVIPMPVDKQYIGQTLNITVTNIVCNNSCWGKVFIEDKTPPVLTCGDTTIRCNQSIDPLNLGFPVAQNMIIDPNNGPNYVANGIDACGSVDLSYLDSLVDRGCSTDSISTIIYRKWTATDISGYEAICWDTIYLRRGNLSDITLPPHYDGLPGHEPALDCDGNWSKLPNGFPDTTSLGTGAPTGILCGKIQFFYQDDTIKVCASSYKLLRRWIIVDWCNPQDRMEYIQQIKVIDNVGPQVTCPTSVFNIGMNKWLCGRDKWALPVPVFDPTGSTANTNSLKHPIVFAECGTWTYEVRHIAAVDAGADINDCAPEQGRGNTNNIRQTGIDPASGLPIFELFDVPRGCNWIYYDIIDDCGNVTSCRFDIFVEDDINPIPVCHEHTVVSLSSDDGGHVRVPASVFDDGSHDNCELDTMLVRRGSSRRLSGYVEFDCNDVGKEIEVELHVFDANGNSAKCKVLVTVQDKTPPVITYCPPDITLDCGTDVSDLSIYGKVEFYDNCDATYDVNPKNGNNYLSNCGTGIITRTFRVTDRGGLSTICQQRITVLDKSPFSRKDIKFPNDTILLNVCRGDISPDILGKPVYFNLDDCNQIAASYEDRVFSYVDSACFKILRFWSVLDWCTYNPNGGGQWDTVQVIKILNNIAPRITTPCATKYFDITEGKCSKNITLFATGSDDCTPNNQLKWSYKFVNKNGQIFTGNRSSVNLNSVSVGRHHITWTVADQCGNTTSCDYDIILKDAKRPTPYCRTGIVTVLMPLTGEIDIWASDFDIGSFDNCTSNSDLKFSFSSNVNDKSRTYYCRDLADGVSDTFEVQMWVTDLAGNQEYCTTHVIIQDNQDVCPDLNVVTSGVISGLVGTEENEVLESTEVYLEDISSKVKNSSVTDQQGLFAFNPIQMGNNYKLSAKYNNDYLNGVSTRDLVIIQKHILGIKDLNSPYKMIAADANDSKSVSTSDIAQLRKLILGKIDELPKVESWRFVDANYVFADPQDPFPINETITIMDIQKDEESNHFIGIKMGDVNSDARVNNLSQSQIRNDEFVEWFIPKMNFESDEIINVPVFTKEDMIIEGFQMTIQLPEAMTLLDIKAGSIQMNSANFETKDISPNLIALSWNEANGQYCDSDVALFTLVLQKSGSNAELKEITESDRLLVTEVYLKDQETKNIRLNYLEKEEDLQGELFELYQNTPNPFNQITTIGFNLPTASRITLSIFDMSGKTIKAYHVQRDKGYGTIDVDLNDLDVSGILYYKLESETHSATRKMVIIR